jgi:AcrR family transcriptional regulator
MAESRPTAPPQRTAGEPRRRAPRRTTARKPLQERGRVRYEAILDVLEALLAETDWDQIGYYQIVERAGMPAASIYHFFPSRTALVTALADRHFEHFRREAQSFTANCDFPRWQDFVAAGHQATVEYYNNHPGAMKLILGLKPFMEIHRSDAATNRIVTDQMVEAFRRMYELPYIQDPHRKFLIVLTIGDAVWRTSLDEHGYITPAYAGEATRAAIAYLRTFLPEDLEPRQDAGATA